MFKSEYQDKLYTKAMNNTEEGSAKKQYLKAIIDIGDENEELLKGLFYDKDLDAAQEDLKNGNFSEEKLKPLKPIQLTTFLLYRFNVFDLQMGIALLIDLNILKIAEEFESSQKIRESILHPKNGIFEKFEGKDDRCTFPCKKSDDKKYISPFKRIRQIDKLGIFKKPSRIDSANAFVFLRNFLAHPLFKDQKVGIKTDFEMSLFDIYKNDDDVTRRQRIANLVIENWNAVNDIKTYVIDIIKNNNNHS